MATDGQDNWRTLDAAIHPDEAQYEGWYAVALAEEVLADVPLGCDFLGGRVVVYRPRLRRARRPHCTLSAYGGRSRSRRDRRGQYSLCLSPFLLRVRGRMHVHSFTESPTAFRACLQLSLHRTLRSDLGV